MLGLELELLVVWLGLLLEDELDDGEGMDGLGWEGEGWAEGLELDGDDDGLGMLGMDELDEEELDVWQPARARLTTPAAIKPVSEDCLFMRCILPSYE